MWGRLFGSVTWDPPAWVGEVRAAEVRGRERLKAATRSEIRTAAFVLGAGAVTAGIVVTALPRLTRSPGVQDLSASWSDPAATPLVTGTVPEPLRLRFDRSAARLSQIGRPVKDGPKLSPPLTGEWRWESDTELTFSPLADWAVGQDYDVSFPRGFFPEHLRYEGQRVRFHTAPFTASLPSSQFYQDPRDPKVKKAVWTLQFSHPVDRDDLAKRVSVANFPFTIEYDELGGRAFVHSGVVPIQANESAVTLTVAPGARAARGGPPFSDVLSGAVAVPGMYTFFRVADAEMTLPRNERWEPEQALVVTLTAGALEKTMSEHVQAWLLPANWDNPLGAAGVEPARLAASSRLDLKALPAAAQYSPTHAFRIKVPPGRHIYVRVTKGAQSFGGFVLAKEWSAVLAVPEFPQEVGLVGDGAVLSLGGDKRLGVTARGLPALRVELSRVRPDQINHLVSQSNGRFKNPDFRWGFGPDNLSEAFTEILPLRLGDPSKTQYAAVDLGRYMAGGEARGLFFLRVEGWDPVWKHRIGPVDERMVLVTDLGLIVKEAADGSRDVFVQSLSAGGPAEGASVSVLAKNGTALFTATTGPDGRVSFPSLRGFDRSREPVAFTARLGADLSFIPFAWQDRRLELSRFDVGGVSGPGAAGGLNAFLFSDRGLYRPGEELRVGLIVKAGEWGRTLAGVPVEFSVVDSRGTEVMSSKRSLSASGFEEVKLETAETSPTGAWEASVYLVKDGRRSTRLGSTTLRVEEFLPDRLRISAAIPSGPGWTKPEGLKARITLHNLFGTPAEGRRVTAKLTLTPAAPALPGWPDHVFFDPAEAKRSFSERLDEVRTDSGGEAEFALPLDRFEKATYRVTVSAEGFEAGDGRGVAAEASALVSDRPYLVGYRPDGDLTRVRKGTARSVELVAVGPSLERVEAGRLEAVLLERRWVSVLSRQDDGTYRYQSVLKESEAGRKPVELAAAGARLPLAADRPGEFVLSLRGSSGLELCRVPYGVLGEANLSRRLDKDAQLEVRVDRADYASGAEIEVSVRAPYAGSGLITIERDRVYASRWFKAGTTASLHRIRVPEGLEGNAYVHVALVRALDSPEVFTNPLSYGVVPFSLSRERRDSGATLAVAGVARPGEPLKISVSSARPARTLVVAVDEGILQVARHATPDPLSHFLAKRALEVNTHQILDLLLPELKLLEAASAPGGDGAAALGRNLNPFKRRRDPAVAFWSGLVDTGPAARELVYKVPDHFNGTLRVMAVSVSTDAVGSAEKKTLVRADFVLTPNLPTFAAPGDEFTVPVAVANNVPGSGPFAEVTVDAAPSAGLSVVDGTRRIVQVPEGRETTVTYRVLARAPLGGAELAFTASGAGRRSALAATLSVRPPLSYRTTLLAGRLTRGAASASPTRSLYKEYRTLEASVSALPLGLARGLSHYLEHYPYGCTEQLVSRAWPSLAVAERPEFGGSRAKAQTDVAAVVRMLASRQNEEGAFGMWAANSVVSDFQTVYAAHFLTDARERGHTVPAVLLERTLGRLKALSESEGGGLSEERERAYALYVLARNGRLSGAAATGLEARLERDHRSAWREDLAALYLASVRRLEQDARRADVLVSGLRLARSMKPDFLHFHDPLARDGAALYLTSRHFPERAKTLRPEDIQGIADEVAGGRYNSLSAATAIAGLAAYADAMGEPAASDAAVYEELESGAPRELTLSKGTFRRAPFSPQAKRLHFTVPGPAFYQVVQAGFDDAAPKVEVKQGLEVQREYRDASGKAVNEASLGGELQVVYRVRSLSGENIPHAALVDLLPGGFEPVLDSLPRFGVDYDGPEESDWRPDYVDGREDRVVFFGDVGPELKEFSYRIKAVNRGAFAVPATFAESMYDRSVQAQGLPGRMTVK